MPRRDNAFLFRSAVGVFFIRSVDAQIPAGFKPSPFTVRFSV
jgi:hypothetical protein